LRGISPIDDVGSTASIAKALNAPVVLIIDSRSLVKSAAAIVLGFKALDPAVKIEGVILNQVKNRRGTVIKEGYFNALNH